MKVIFSKDCLAYGVEGHPESPRRVSRTYHLLLEKGFDFVEPEPCLKEDILKVHSARLLKAIKEGDFYDSDTPNIPKIYDYARLSAGAGLLAAEIALGGEFAFSLMRPPGHHASRDRLGGFCYFNNIAIATARALERVGRVAIVDIDCHHGNGTEEIFLGEKRVLYLSLHQSPLYPGTGLSSIANCLNYPLPPGTGEDDYLATFEGALLKVKGFNPELVAISAGFDTYRGDPLTQIQLEKETYSKIASLLRDLDKPLFALLEGGYSLDLPECIFNFLKIIPQLT